MLQKKSGLLALAFALCALLLASGAAQAKTELVSKVDSFVLFVDYSGSMAMTNADAKLEKIEMAKDLLAKMNEKIPALGYDSRLTTFAPTSKLYSGIYDRAAMAKGIGSLATGFEIFGRLTPMGGGLQDIRPTLDALKGRIAVIVFSDGESNLGANPVPVATELYNAFGGRLCFHTVSFADKPEGQATMDAIGKLSGCSVTASAMDLLGSEAALDKFVRDVFYDEVEIAEPAPAPAPVAEVMPLRIHFDFDSAKIRDDMAPILDEAAEQIKARGGSVTLEGHTCSIGSDAYNQGLSERRADSVKKYLAGQGISADAMATVGKGESMPKYDNNTDEGRKLNRRVEIIFE
ncbi:OmpA family protein [Desulfocurvus vexinensis]|uniref:OmpA family protein n=1 Tax=Desulfocurvus vexinensis TaxID=399548 RepID=UPI00048FC4E1|nr:OmpA family protein [Desulfocurvus vexinensis]